MGAPARRTTSDHPLAEAAGRAARAAAVRAEELVAHRARLNEGTATTVGDLADAVTYLAEAQGRNNEAQRRLLTQRLAVAHHRAVGQDVTVAARRLARLTLAEDVRKTPLDP
jgi:hypothetical protein